MALQGETASNSVVFLYKGQHRGQVPSRTTHLIIHSTVSKVGMELLDDDDEPWESNMDEFQTFLRSDRNLGCFVLCTYLMEVTIQEGVRILGAMTFHMCSTLKRIAFPSSVEIIGKAAFMRCRSLVEVELREGLRMISHMAFNSCTSLKQIALP